MAETITLDPTGIATGRTQMDITSLIKWDGIDWGDAEITAFLADQQYGSSTVDFRVPNRKIQIPLVLKDGAALFTARRSQLQYKTSLFQREGGWIGRKLDSTQLYADVIDATLHLGGSTLQAFKYVDADAVLQLDALPDWYGNEIVLSDHVETTLPHLIFTEAATYTTSYPARMRLVIDNDQSGINEQGLIWGFRSRYYDAAGTAALFYEAESLQRLNNSTTLAQVGTLIPCSGGSTVQSAVLPSGVWVAVLSTSLSAPTPMTHQGTYRVWARVQAGSAPIQLRLSWGVATLSASHYNDPVSTPSPSSQWYLVDLGVVRLDAPPVGSNQWFGVISAKSVFNNDTIYIDCIWYQPLDDGAGKLVASTQQSPAIVPTGPTLTGSGVDNASVGSVAWSNPTNIQVDDANAASVALTAGGSSVFSHYLVGTQYGFAIPVATITGIQVDVLVANLTSGVTDVKDSGVFLMKAGTIQATNRADTVTIWPSGFTQRTYGGISDLWGGTWLNTDINTSTFGAVLGIGTLPGQSGTCNARVLYMKMTIYWQYATGFVVATDAVIYGTQSLELRTEGAWRSSGGIYGPVGSAFGDNPRLPISGTVESRTTQVLVKATRGTFNTPDPGIDDISARITYRPTYLITP